MHEARLFGLVVHDRDKEAVRLYAVEQRLDHLVREEEVPFAEEFRVTVDAVEFRHQGRIGRETPDALLQYRLVACNHDDVGFVGRLIEAYVREYRVERLQNVQEHEVVEFVRLNPLHPEGARFHVATHLGVEFMRKEPCHAAHPRVRGYADNHVVLAAVRMEESRRIVDENVDARIVVTAVVPRVESLCKVHHRLLDFHAVEILEQGVGEQVMRSHATSETDHRGIVRFGLYGHRHKGGGCLRKLVA